jgi:hypothetical protein
MLASKHYHNTGVFMKMLGAFLLIVLSMSSFASSQTKTFFFDGSQDSIEMVLRAEKTHTEYRFEQRRTICYRQDVFYRRICRQTPQGHVCHTVPEYRTVSYSCIETVSIPYEVKDYDVEAKVSLEVADLASSLPAAETFKVTLDGDDLRLSATGSKNFFIILKKKNVHSHMTGSLKLMTAAYSAELVEAGPVVKALDMTNISMKDNVLSFTMGPVSVRNLIGFRLTVSKAPLLGSDTVLFDRELASSEIDLKVSEVNSNADVNIQKLGVTLSSGRHLLTAKAFYKHTGTILNVSEFERTEAGRTLIYKVR